MAEEPNAASVALIDGDRVLLVQRARPPFAGLWTLPGGRREPRETARHCAVREVREELGIAVGSLVPVTVRSVPETSGGTWRLEVFGADAFAGEITPSDEVADHRWVRLAEVAELDTTPGLGTTLELAVRALQQMA